MLQQDAGDAATTMGRTYGEGQNLAVSFRDAGKHKSGRLMTLRRRRSREKPERPGHGHEFGDGSHAPGRPPSPLYNRPPASVAHARQETLNTI